MRVVDPALPCTAYLINLDRSPERLTAMARRLDDLGIPWQRVRAVDGETFGPPPWPGYDERSYRRFVGKFPHANELGCYLSHLAALQKFLADGQAFGLILEDDAEFADDLATVLPELLRRAEHWDVLKLSGIHHGMPATTLQLSGRHRLVAYLQRQTGAAAYLVQPRAAHAYVEGLLPMRVPYDHEFDKAWRYGIRLRGVEPRPVSARGHRSTINIRHAAIRMPWYLRLGVLWYRTRTETRRILHYLLTDTEWLRFLLVRRDT